MCENFMVERNEELFFRSHPLSFMGRDRAITLFFIYIFHHEPCCAHYFLILLQGTPRTPFFLSYSFLAHISFYLGERGIWGKKALTFIWWDEMRGETFCATLNVRVCIFREKICGCT